MTIVNNTVNDCAMTVLPDAPIDPATGLQVPTIAVATAGGVSVIKDDGTVVDSAATAAMRFVEFYGNDLYFATSTYYYNLYRASTFAADGFGVSVGYSQADQSLRLVTGCQSVASNGRELYIAGNFNTTGRIAGVQAFSLNSAALATSMSALLTSTYNTGWMNGNIKGAFLSDTSATALVGSGEIWSGTPDRIDANWTDNLDATYTSNGSAGFIGFASPAPLITGKTYVVEITVDSITSGSVSLPYDGTGFVVKTSVGAYVGTFVADAGGTSNGVYVYSNNFAGTVSNISVKLADADRSVNNNGLIVNGTITRTAVATGANLVAYSGFSAANYLEQPYNSALDFGTGDFCVMGWVNGWNPAAGQYTVISRQGANPVYFSKDSASNKMAVFQSGRMVEINSVTQLNQNSWSHIAFVRSGSLMYFYINGSFDNSASMASWDFDLADGAVQVGTYAGSLNNGGSLALLRISATAPSAEQIAKIYNDERPLFQDGAQATLYGTSDAVTALAYDDDTNLLSVGTSAGRSDFQGLRRVANTTTAVSTFISANAKMIVEQ
jgi:trimeric autotransporter adhesin